MELDIDNFFKSFKVLEIERISEEIAFLAINSEINTTNDNLSKSFYLSRTGFGTKSLDIDKIMNEFFTKKELKVKIDKLKKELSILNKLRTYTETLDIISLLKIKIKEEKTIKKEDYISLLKKYNKDKKVIESFFKKNTFRNNK